MELRRGQIILMDWTKYPENPSVISGIRPSLIISNNKGNKHSTILSCLPLIDRLEEQSLKTHIPINKKHYPILLKDSFIVIDQLRTLDRIKIKSIEPKTFLRKDDMQKVEEALIVHLELINQ